jgi:hypothetical protein
LIAVAQAAIEHAESAGESGAALALVGLLSSLVTERRDLDRAHIERLAEDARAKGGS